ncbi:MAG: hypothetical protein QOJ20_1986 [Mycobacterium sp.]|nr:hypothetical protein [Mycobacterium sp.]
MAATDGTRPDALTAPSPDCPVALVRVLRQLETDGYGEAVTQLACALCGRTCSVRRERNPRPLLTLPRLPPARSARGGSRSSCGGTVARSSAHATPPCSKPWPIAVCQDAE